MNVLLWSRCGTRGRGVAARGRTWGMTLLLAAVLVAVAHAAPKKYEDYTKEELHALIYDDPPTLHVHLIPHAHCDPGWVKTFEGYYDSEVSKILPGVMAELKKDKAHKFNWAETCYFKKWFDMQTQETKDMVKGFVADGQLEFLGGGWVQNDEAVANYEPIIHQMTLGHEYLRQELGVTPRYGWQIDPFGASRATATMFRQMCFKGHVIDRVDVNLEAVLDAADGPGLEFVWRGTPSLGASDDLFTHIMGPDMYCTPAGFDFEHPQNGNPPITPENVQARAEDFVGQLRVRSTYYKTNILLVPFGCDFAFQNASCMFDNMDRLLAHINAQSVFAVDVAYSTVDEYFTAVHNAAKTWKRYEGDFLPYCTDWATDGGVRYWTGFYTSREAEKGFSRMQDAVLRNAEVVFALARAKQQQQEEGGQQHAPQHAPRHGHAPHTRQHVLQGEALVGEGDAAGVDAALYADLINGREASAFLQHHDAITGTSVTSVVADWDRRLAEAVARSEHVMANVTRVLSGVTPESGAATHAALTADEITALQAGKTVALTVVNSLAWERADLLRVPFHLEDGLLNWHVTDTAGTVLPAQVLPDVQDGRPGAYVLFIAVDKLPALGSTTLLLTSPKAAAFGAAMGMYEEHTLELLHDNDAPLSGCGELVSPYTDFHMIENAHVKVLFSKSSGVLCGVVHEDATVATPVQQEYLQYHSTVDGAYIFYPDGAAHPLDAPIQLLASRVGPLAVQMVQYLTPTVTQVFTLYTNPIAAAGVAGGAEHVQVDTHVGPLAGNRDFISRYTSRIASRGVLYTDDNGMQMNERHFNPAEPRLVSGNYYPMVSSAYIGDATTQLGVVTARPMGVSSQSNGSLEFMVHRRTLQDDGRGMNQPLNDTTRIYVSTLLVLGTPTTFAARRHALSLLHNNPVALLTDVLPAAAPAAGAGAPWSALAHPLPANVHMLTLKARNASSTDVVLRLQHLYEPGEDAHLSAPVTVDLSTLLAAPFTLSDVKRQTMSLMFEHDQCTPWTWQTEGTYGEVAAAAAAAAVPPPPSSGDTSITLQPLEIATFTVTLSA